MDAGILRGIFTAIMLLLFIGVCVWAYSGKRRKDFEEAARLPLDSEDDEHASARQRGRTGYETE